MTVTEEERANLVVDDYGWIVNGDPERGPSPRGSNAGSSRRRSARSKTNAVPVTTTTLSSTASVVRIPEKQLKLNAKRTKKWEKMLKEWCVCALTAAMSRACVKTQSAAMLKAFVRPYQERARARQGEAKEEVEEGPKACT
jgi:hypothetical protein